MSESVLPVLYSFRRCPFAMRARLALHVSGVAYEHREVVLKNKPAHMLALSPKGTVPVLWLPDALKGAYPQVIDQSLDIMLWALHQHDPHGWLVHDAQHMQDSLQAIEQIDSFFKIHLDRYKYPQRFGLQSGTDHRDLACHFLMGMDQTLQNQGFLNGPHWGLADAATAPFVRQFARVDLLWFELQNWPALLKWLRNFEASSSFIHIMKKTMSSELGSHHPSITQGFS